MAVTFGLAGADSRPLKPDEATGLVLELFAVFAVAFILGWSESHGDVEEIAFIVARFLGGIYPIALCFAGRFRFTSLYQSCS